MKEISRINHVGIRVKSLAVSREFYEKLGFLFIEGPVGPEPVAVMEHPCGININFILNASPTAGPNLLMDVPEKHTGYTHMALEVSDLEAVKQQLESLKIPISGGPITIPSGATFIFIRDPDANVIELHLPPSS
ncbi:VOC family protein [Alginatibacterium sediminis]|uniref:VOC family protein n=1 Tax=Alginatibacterium sediminis TaxID=2164068 RepID=A0A420E8T1_9ALTE|nr:VOC family protein [Alginatibacterium sediminis]RKF15787.1 VOC family protein [Alginatibacterium sediminis]